MGLRGPKPKRLKIVSPAAPKRPDPPRGMSPKARAIWHRVTGAHAPNHFKPQHLDLLRMYCYYCVLEKDAELGAYREGIVTKQINGGSKESPYITIGIKAQAAAAALATKLAITVNAISVTRGTIKSVQAKKSGRGDLISGSGTE